MTTLMVYVERYIAKRVQPCGPHEVRLIKLHI